MEKKIYCINWLTCQDGFIYNGCVLATSKEEANNELIELHKQSLANFSDGMPINVDEFHEYEGYFVSCNSENIERAEIVIKTIDVSKLEDA